MASEENVPPHPFAYPQTKHTRRHGPFGYGDYESYRDWLRDEFTFRCVYCLFREEWGLKKAAWDIDHYLPQSRHPAGLLDYDNLYYVCRSCNSSKSIHLVPDPGKVAFGKCVKVHDDGTITALNEDGEWLIQVLRLDNPDYTRNRYRLLRTVRSASSWADIVLWLGYPNDLPDLSRLKPPGNTRPAGVSDSYFARRARGDLEEVY